MSQLQQRFTAFKLSSYANICVSLICCIAVVAIVAAAPLLTTETQSEDYAEVISGEIGFGFGATLTCLLYEGNVGSLNCPLTGSCLPALDVASGTNYESHLNSFIATVAMGSLVLLVGTCVFSCCAASAFNPEPKPLFPGAGAVEKYTSCCTPCAESSVCAAFPLIGATVMLLGVTVAWNKYMSVIVEGDLSDLCNNIANVQVDPVNIGSDSSCYGIGIGLGVACKLGSEAGFSLSGSTRKSTPALKSLYAMAILPLIMSLIQLVTYIRLKQARSAAAASGDVAALGADSKQYLMMGDGAMPVGPAAGQMYAPPQHQGQMYAPQHQGQMYAPQHQGQMHAPQHEGQMYAPQHQGQMYAPQHQGQIYAPQHQGQMHAPQHQGQMYAPQAGGQMQAPETGGQSQHTSHAAANVSSP